MIKETEPKDEGNEKENIARSEKNPYKTPALIRLLGVFLCCAGYLTMRIIVNVDNYALLKTVSFIAIIFRINLMKIIHLWK